jgi:glutamyl-tRNA synthetase
VQSQRLNIYKTWAQKLIEQGRAYADPYSEKDVQLFREQAKSQKKPFLYRDNRPAKTSTWDGSQPLRFKSDPKNYNFSDAVMGEISTGPEVIDDFVLIKSDGFPTYNFAHIIDDFEMKITHILRGQEFLASIPNYLNLYEALAINPPIIATLPPVLGPDGKKKLSKRDGAKDVLDYIKLGYLEEALISFMATLGWNDGSTKEIFSRNELIDSFSLDRIGRSGAKFDDKRLNWLNGHVIRSMTLEELFVKSKDFWPEEAKSYSPDYLKQVLGLLQERLKYLAEIKNVSRLFLVDLPINPQLISEHKQLSKLSSQELIAILKQAKQSLKDSDFTVDDLNNHLNKLLDEINQKPIILFSLIRIATTQAPFSPGLSDSLSVIGKEKSLERIDAQINYLQKNN